LAALRGVFSAQSSCLTQQTIDYAGFAVGRDFDKRPILSGMLTFKPQLGLLLPVLLPIAGRRRVIASAVVTTIILAALTASWFGSDVWVE
jgi:hypothetical protein